MATPRKLIDEVLELPDAAREELLRALIDSLDEKPDGGHVDRAKAWDDELARRIDDDDNDRNFVDGPAAIQQVRDEILGR